MISLFDTTYKAHLLRRKIGIVLFGALLFAILIYGLLIKQTVSNIVERKELQREYVRLESRLAALESDYISLTEDLTKTYAKTLGFVVEPTVYYAIRTDTPDAVTVRE